MHLKALARGYSPTPATKQQFRMRMGKKVSSREGGACVRSGKPLRTPSSIIDVYRRLGELHKLCAKACERNYTFRGFPGSPSPDGQAFLVNEI